MQITRFMCGGKKLQMFINRQNKNRKIRAKHLLLSLKLDIPVLLLSETFKIQVTKVLLSKNLIENRAHFYRALLAAERKILKQAPFGLLHFLSTVLLIIGTML